MFIYSWRVYVRTCDLIRMEIYRVQYLLISGNIEVFNRLRLIVPWELWKTIIFIIQNAVFYLRYLDLLVI